jgi:hypothetical protein
MQRLPSSLPIALVVAVMAFAPALAATVSGAGFDTERFVPVEELKPGDRCVGRTVFSGTAIEEFEVEILGIVRGSAPGSDLIIARAFGETLERTGILQGMSGSPVYLDGRLVGAMSSTWAYTKEPIGGITPIAEMLPALDAMDDETGELRRGSGGFGRLLFPEGEFASSRIGWLTAASGARQSPEGLAAGSSLGSYEGRALTPIDVPLVVSGGGDRFLAQVEEILGGAGVTVVRGSGAGQIDAVSELEPGSAVGVQFVSGDVSWTAIGTVTHREGNDIVAFGHPLFNAGRVETPMVGAFVHTLLPLQTVSQKFASGGATVGTFRQDRRRMVAGRIGPVPDMMPLRVRIDEEGYGSSVFEFEVMRMPPYSSLFAGLAASGAVSQAVFSAGRSSAELRLRIQTGDNVVEYATTFFTADLPLRAGGELSALMDFVFENSFETREISSAELTVDVFGERRQTFIERVEIDRPIYHPGDEVVVSVTLRDWEGARTTRTVTLAIPSSVGEDPLLLRVGGADSYHEWEAERLGAGLRPRNFEQHLALIQRSKPGNAVVAQLVSGRPGLSLHGGELRDVPGKAALVLGSSATSGAVDLVEYSLVDQTEFTTDREAQGYHELVLVVREDD